MYIYIYLSLPLFPFIRGEVLPATSSPPYLLFFSTLLCLLSSPSSLPPLLSSSHPSLHSPPISVLAFLVSSCAALVTLPLSSVVGHRPSFLRVQPTVLCSWPVSPSSSSGLPSLPLTPSFFACLPSLLLLFFGPNCSRTLAAFVVAVRSVPRFPFRTGKLVWHKCSWPCLQSILDPFLYFVHRYTKTSHWNVHGVIVVRRSAI